MTTTLERDLDDLTRNVVEMGADNVRMKGALEGIRAGLHIAASTGAMGAELSRTLDGLVAIGLGERGPSNLSQRMTPRTPESEARTPADGDGE